MSVYDEELAGDLTSLISKAYNEAIDARHISTAYRDVATAILAAYTLRPICRHEWGPTLREPGSAYERRWCVHGCLQSRFIPEPWVPWSKYPWEV